MRAPSEWEETSPGVHERAFLPGLHGLVWEVPDRNFVLGLLWDDRGRPKSTVCGGASAAFACALLDGWASAHLDTHRREAFGRWTWIREPLTGIVALTFIQPVEVV